MLKAKEKYYCYCINDKNINISLTVLTFNKILKHIVFH